MYPRVGVTRSCGLPVDKLKATTTTIQMIHDHCEQVAFAQVSSGCRFNFRSVAKKAVVKDWRPCKRVLGRDGLRKGNPPLRRCLRSSRVVSSSTKQGM